jgi:predicted TIM-barrel fold metal-dependent hydrolase
MFPDKGGFFQWVTLMTWCESKIWAAVREAYPDVQLFVAHMMDMENYYPPSKPRYRWPDEQLRRMAKLTRAAEGRLLTFFAFDPKRDDWEALLDRALASGCAGVKFYPPNGYPPFDAKTNSIPPTTAAFFRRCVRDGIPLFTHATSHGFEAMTGNGKKYANPKLWRRVLETPEFSTLRLCFAHAGGDDGWFPRDGEAAPAEEPFSKEVVALCREFPNVYCEVAYLSPILTPQGQKSFQVALERANAAGGTYPFAKKVMYGSDWHMIHKIRDHRAYLQSFHAALADAKWNGVRDDFFSRNAARWLDLAGYVKRMREKHPGVLTEKAAQHLQGLAV